MTNVSQSFTSPVSSLSFSSESEVNAYHGFLDMMENAKMEAQNSAIADMDNEGCMHPVSPATAKINPPVEHDMDETGEEIGEDFPPQDEQDNGIDVSDPLAPYADELLNICFKGAYGVQIDFVQRKGSEARNAAKVLMAQQKGKFALTIQRVVETEGETEYLDLITIAPEKGAASSMKRSSTASASPRGKTPEQLAEIERQKEAKRLEEERKAQEKAEKAELRAKAKAAEELQAAMKAARNAPEEGTLASMQFDMLHRAQGATYGELGLASNIVNGGWKTTIRQFAKRFNKVILAQYRNCTAKPGIKTYAAYKLIDNTETALSSLPAGWVIDPTA